MYVIEWKKVKSEDSPQIHLFKYFVNSRFTTCTFDSGEDLTSYRDISSKPNLEKVGLRLK